jgi:hypothetical protein
MTRLGPGGLVYGDNRRWGGEIAPLEQIIFNSGQHFSLTSLWCQVHHPRYGPSDAWIYRQKKPPAGTEGLGSSGFERAADWLTLATTADHQE